MRKIFKIVIFMISISAMSNAQDVQFSQFYASSLNLAPSFAGSQGLRAVGNFRDQWPKIPGQFISYAFSVDYLLKKYNSGVGFFMFTDNAGSGKIVTSNIGFAYSYKVKITKDFYFQPGLAAYYYSQITDYNSLDFADQFSFLGNQFSNPSVETFPQERVNHADFSFSSLGYLKDMWFGFTTDHLMTISPVLNKNADYKRLKISVFGGYKFELRTRTRNIKNQYIHVAFNYRYQSKMHQLDLGGYYNYDPFVFGLWYRGIPLVNEFPTSDALIYQAGVRYKDYIFSYSYDMTIGKLISQTGGSHEISIVYNLNRGGKLKNKKYKSIPCPQF